MNPLPTLLASLLLVGCAAVPPAQAPVSAPGFPGATEPRLAWPTLAACLAATPAPPPGAADRTCVRIDLENAWSPTFVLYALEVEVDGALLFARQEPRGVRGPRGPLGEMKALTAFLGPLVIGDHELRLVTWMLPDTTVQPSLAGYRWMFCGTHHFTVTPGGGFEERAILYEKGDARTPLEGRPAARYVENGVASVRAIDARVARGSPKPCLRSAPGWAPPSR